MAKKKRKSSKIEQEYRRIRRNFLARVRSWSRKGFIFVDEVVPQIPKRITQGSINRLNKINRNLSEYQQAYVDFNTGELFSPREGRRRYREDVKRYRETGNIDEYSSAPNSVDTIIENFYDLIQSYVYGSPWKGRMTDRRDFATAWLNDAIQRWEKKKVASMLQQGKANGNWLSVKEAYDAIKLQNSLRSMAQTLGASEQEVNDVIDSLWTEYFE
jgi:hypothetical protein